MRWQVAGPTSLSAGISHSSKRLSRRPSESAPSEQVDVQVVDRLPAVFAVVDDDAVSLVQAARAGNLRSCSQKMTQQKPVVLLRARQRVKMLARGNQNMGRRLRVDVRKGVALLILINSGGRNCAFNNLAKQAAHNGTSVPDDARPGLTYYTGPV